MILGDNTLNKKLAVTTSAREDNLGRIKVQHSLLDEPGSYCGIGFFAELCQRGNPSVLNSIDNKSKRTQILYTLKHTFHDHKISSNL